MKLTDIKNVRDLIDLMLEHGISELEVKTRGSLIRITRSTPNIAPIPAQAPLEGKKESPEAELLEIKSPMVGTFFHGPSPEAEAFVKKGDHVLPDTIVCMIEAMKIPSEIPALVSGTVVKICLENQQPVEYGQLLFLVKPD